MSEITTTKKINLDQLGYESGIDLNTIFEPTGEIVISSSVAQNVLDDFVKNHNANDNWVNPEPVKEISIEDKLASVGLSVADLKTALGL